MGKTHNFYTARSHWSRRPFEVLFAGHLQAFLITGSLRGASLPPSFCLPALGGEGVSLHGQFISRLESPLPNTRARARSQRSVPALGCPATGILATLGKPLRQSVLQQSLVTWRLQPASWFRAPRVLHGAGITEENCLFAEKVFFPIATALHPMGVFLAGLLVGTLQEKGSTWSVISASDWNNKA